MEFSACVVPTVKHGGGVMGCFAGDTVSDLFRRVTSMATIAFYGYLTKESDGVLPLTWPPQSPNLNPFGMSWTAE